MLDCFLNYSVNPNLRFHSRIDKIIDDVIREKINIPHKFRMRLESRHCIESRITVSYTHLTLPTICSV